MDIKQLYYFVTIVEEKTISGAARKLHISQPPLSTAIKQLEHELGTTLFQRGNRRIYLTDSGKLLYSQACSIIKLYENTIESIKDNTNGVKGTLKIGVISSTENIFLEKFALQFHELYPDIRFELYEGNTYELIDMLNSRIIELAFVRTPYTPNDLEFFTIGSEPLVAFGDKRFFEDMKEDMIYYCDLAQKPLIVYRRWLSIIKQEFQKREINPYFICINDDARTSIAWIEKGMGIGILPESSSLMLHGDNLQVKYFKDLHLTSDIVCMFTPEILRSSATQMLYEYISTMQLDNKNTKDC